MTFHDFNNVDYSGDNESILSRQVPITMGYEIEQRSRDLPPDLKWSSPYKWASDGSGPLETTFKVGALIKRKINDFCNWCIDNNATWNWKSEYEPEGSETRSIYGGGLNGCGSHIHFAVKEDDIPPYKLSEAWSCLYNTILTVSLILSPMMMHGSEASYRHEFGARRGVADWAKILDPPTRYSPGTFQIKFMNDDFKAKDRQYHWLTPNGVNFETKDGIKTKVKPLTVELRCNEAHPTATYGFSGYIMRIARKCFERDYMSPKLLHRNPTIKKLKDAIYESCGFRRYTTFIVQTIFGARQVTKAEFRNTGKNIYECMEGHDIKLDFKRSIPGCKLKYDSWFECFNDILTQYSLRSIESKRIEYLFRQKGEPFRNNNALWRVFREPKGSFRWEEPGIQAPDEIPQGRRLRI